MIWLESDCFGIRRHEKCPLFRAATSKNIHMAIDWCALNPSLSLCCKCSRSQSVGWAFRETTLSVMQSEVPGREKLLGWMRILYCAAGQSEQRKNIHIFMHWVILLCVLGGLAIEMHYVSVAVALSQESLDEWGGERRREMNGFARAQRGETGGRCGSMAFR